MTTFEFIFHQRKCRYFPPCRRKN